MTADISREVWDLYKMFGINPHPDIQGTRIDLKDVDMTDEEIISFLKDGVVPNGATNQPLLDTQPATDDN